MSEIYDSKGFVRGIKIRRYPDKRDFWKSESVTSNVEGSRTISKGKQRYNLYFKVDDVEYEIIIKYKTLKNIVAYIEENA